MWDINQIIEQNNQEALNAIMAPQEIQELQRPNPESWSLSLLADILHVGPPLLQEMVNCLTAVNSAKEFSSLVRMLLPEHRQEIMAAPRNKRVYIFCFYFGKKYYPLPANTDCSPMDWVNSMPVELLGMSYTAYHDLDMRPGFLMLLSLVVYPYEGDERDTEDDNVPFNPAGGNYKPKQQDIDWLNSVIGSLGIGGEWIAPMGFKIIKTAEREIKLALALDTPAVRETIQATLAVAAKAGIKAKYKPGRKAKEKVSAARVPLLDKVQNLVGADIVVRIPSYGWTPEELHKMLEGTNYDGVAEFADWACSQTGCVMLDSNYESCDYSEGDGEPTFKWTKRNVDILTEQWPKVKLFRQKIDHAVEWLEQDQVNHFAELVNWLADYHLPKTPHKKRLYEPELCDLDQPDPEDEDEN